MWKWKWKCPICGKTIKEKYKFSYIKRCVGKLHNCPECGGLILIDEGGVCVDFTSVLKRVSGQIDEMERNAEIRRDTNLNECVDVKDDGNKD